jgi:hypothetical protein
MQLLQPLLERYIRTLSRNEQVDELVKEIPIDPISFAYLGAVLLQVSPIQKQSFLEIRNCIDLLEKLRTNYRREVALAESVLENQAPATQGSFSLN